MCRVSPSPHPHHLSPHPLSTTAARSSSTSPPQSLMPTSPNHSSYSTTASPHSLTTSPSTYKRSPPPVCSRATSPSPLLSRSCVLLQLCFPCLSHAKCSTTHSPVLPHLFATHRRGRSGAVQWEEEGSVTNRATNAVSCIHPNLHTVHFSSKANSLSEPIRAIRY